MLCNGLNAKVNNVQLDPHISLHQTNAKVAATSNIRPYGIFANNTVNHQLVNDLLFKCNYIYVPKVWSMFVNAATIAQYEQGNDYDKSKPYEHPVIIDVIHMIFFLPTSPITVQYPDPFKFDEMETLKLLPSMVALAATMVCHSINWIMCH